MKVNQRRSLPPSGGTITGFRTAGLLVIVCKQGPYQDSPYLVTELLEGETLRQRIQSRPVPARRATDYALQIVRGLVAAHDKGVLHRDLKPENIFLTQRRAHRNPRLRCGKAHAPRRRFRQCRCSNRSRWRIGPAPWRKSPRPR